MDPTLTYHLLNGDALADKLNQSFPLNNFIICRECLMDGVVQAPTLEAFWINRADFIAETFHLPQAEYFEKVVKELDKYLITQRYAYGLKMICFARPICGSCCQFFLQDPI